MDEFSKFDRLIEQAEGWTGEVQELAADPGVDKDALEQHVKTICRKLLVAAEAEDLGGCLLCGG